MDWSPCACRYCAGEGARQRPERRRKHASEERNGEQTVLRQGIAHAPRFSPTIPALTFTVPSQLQAPIPSPQRHPDAAMPGGAVSGLSSLSSPCARSPSMVHLFQIYLLCLPSELLRCHLTPSPPSTIHAWAFFAALKLWPRGVRSPRPWHALPEISLRRPPAVRS